MWALLTGLSPVCLFGRDVVLFLKGWRRRRRKRKRKRYRTLLIGRVV